MSRNPAYRPHPRRISLLDADPELGSGLSREEFEEARRAMVADVAVLGRGTHEPWSVGSPDLLGLVIVDGLIIRSVEVAGRRCGELVGPGEIVRPWDHFGNYAPLPFEVSWRVIRPARLALLEQQIVTVAARWPIVMHTIMVRAIGRSHALALNVAINSLQHIELRLLVLFWHLADRFGRVTPEGAVVPLTLTHSDIAELIGARRPSVSGRLASLSLRNQLQRRADRTWLLPGEPPKELQDLRARAISLGDTATIGRLDTAHARVESVLRSGRGPADRRSGFLAELAVEREDREPARRCQGR